MLWKEIFADPIPVSLITNRNARRFWFLRSAVKNNLPSLAGELNGIGRDVKRDLLELLGIPKIKIVRRDHNAFVIHVLLPVLTKHQQMAVQSIKKSL